MIIKRKELKKGWSGKDLFLVILRAWGRHASLLVLLIPQRHTLLW